MNYTIKIENKKVYNSLVQFLKSLGISIITADKPYSSEWTKSKRQHHFKAVQLKTKGVKFNREEANER